MESSAPFELPGMHARDHRFELPLVPGAPDGRTVTVFAREVVAAERAHDRLPWLLFLQGGPGSPAPRPETRSGWLKRALKGYRVLLLDQRGTGLSSPVSAASVAALGEPRAQAAYLTHFRADAIVADAEAIRARLSPEEPWTILGQSFGGFCAVRYLSSAPDGLRAALITGGLPSLDRPAEEVYRATYPRVARANRAAFQRFPGLQQGATRIAERLRRGDVRLPNGQTLDVRTFGLLGLPLGFQSGPLRLHDLVQRAFERTPAGEELSYLFLHRVLTDVGFHVNPLFSVLHEAIYAQGEATRWAAQRVRAEFPEFDPGQAEPFRFTGEMVYPWIVESFPPLAPLREAAELLAAKEDWPRLYDERVLERNRVPVAAVVYHDDMFVDAALSLETAERVANVRTWVTNEYQHDGLRADGERILDRLLAMLPPGAAA